MKNEIHIGKLIRQHLTESGLSVFEFANAIHKTRTNVYDIFKRKNVDIELLMAISETLHFDFINCLHDANSTAKTPTRECGKYLVVKIVEESDLEKEKTVLFSYKLDM